MMIQRFIKICDFCFKDIPKEEQSWKITKHEKGVKDTKEDCCYDCYHKFKNVVKSGG
jgi:hypothetical protein